MQGERAPQRRVGGHHEVGVVHTVSNGVAKVTGLPEMREAAAGYLSRRFGLSVDPETEILPTQGSKEAIFQRLLDQYWERVLAPELALNRIFAKADFPDDLEEMAGAIEEVVEEERGEDAHEDDEALQ